MLSLSSCLKIGILLFGLLHWEGAGSNPASLLPSESMFLTFNILNYELCIISDLFMLAVCLLFPTQFFVDACSRTLCRPGQHCEIRTIYCFRAPCPSPQAECVQNQPTQITCANVRCAQNCVMQTKCDNYGCKQVPVCVGTGTSN